MKNADKSCLLSFNLTKKISFNIFMTLSYLLHLKAQKSEKIIFLRFTLHQLNLSYICRVNLNYNGYKLSSCRT